MKRTTLEFEKKVIKDFRPIALSLRKSGWSNNRISSFIRKCLKSKEKNAYNAFNKRDDWVNEVLLELKGADSKAEKMFYFSLEDENIDFEFQYKIGNYRVDFFIPESLIVEIDGPHHNFPKQIEYDKKRDKYLEGLGYQVLRVPIILMTYDPGAVIKEIKGQMPDEFKQVVDKAFGDMP